MQVIYEENFEVKEADLKKHFDRVSRIECTSNYSDNLTLDINTDIFPIDVNFKFSLRLAKRIEDSAKDESFYDPSIENNLVDFDYVMFGKVYRIAGEKESRLSVFASFGGLLMKLTGSAQSFQVFETDLNIFLLIKKL
eukprot:TRINITY_DN2685_c0_g1_i1.p1 TRINITY_DN2685_c0_g1~~TRINITY_DN2685_c0_g1_i1.p1  ORF type:complete len:138 (-),score=58.64 TRINITY_DN2685_c0_g1_i1:87-500(-)